MAYKYTTANWKDDLLLNLPGGDWNAIEHEVRATLVEFCIQSGAWIETRRAITLVEDKSDYRIPMDTDKLILNIVGYYPNMTDSYKPQLTRLRQAPHPPAYSPSTGVIRIVPTPDSSTAGNTVTPVVTLRPYNTASVPDDAFTHWYDGIYDGVMGRLCRQIGKPWTDAKLAAYHLRRFRRAISEQRDIARRRYSVTESEWVFPPWA